MGYGVRWSEWTRQGRLVTKQRFFATEKGRGTFAAKLEEKDNFHAFVAWCDPEEQDGLEDGSSKSIVC